MKADLHVHSSFSKRSSIWLLNKIGCGESYTDPRRLYDIVRDKGMDFVTITDHNTIDGCLEIMHLPGTFLGCEVTTYFPADPCKMHVLVYGMSEVQYREIDRLRKNIFEMVAYLQEHKIYHVCAHPFFPVNGRQTVEHFEQCLLLFEHFEINGDDDGYANEILLAILKQLTKEDIDKLAEKYGHYPNFEKPWIKGITGGSDDHSSLYLAEMYTEVDNTDSLESFFSGLRAKRGQAISKAASTPKRLARNIYGVAYQFYNDRFELVQHRDRHILIQFLDRMLRESTPSKNRFWDRIFFEWKRRKYKSIDLAKSDNLFEILQRMTHELITNDHKLMAKGGKDLGMAKHGAEQWFHFVDQVTNGMLNELGHRAVKRIRSMDLFKIFETIGSAGSLYALMAPYTIGYSVYSSNRRLAESVAQQFVLPDSLGQMDVRVGLFTDTLDDVNGVALTLRNQAKMANESGKNLTVITCRDWIDKDPSGQGVKYFKPIGSVEMPEYEGQTNYIPPLLQMLDFCFNKHLTHIHAATPGFIGLAGLAIARCMKLPFCTTYHTAFPQYAMHLTNDSSIEELMWKYMIWFYDQSDVIFVSSKASEAELVEKGISPDKIQIMPRGVDINRFQPATMPRENNQKHEIQLLYVGRVSKEKNLPVLEKVYQRISKQNKNIRLNIVGDGPYRQEMEKHLLKTNTVFTGYLKGDALSEIYRESDLFVFPSTTDTFGNVVLEAQASGIPVIVTDMGGPMENLVPDETGLIIHGNDEQALYDAIMELSNNSYRLAQMGMRARLYAQERSLENSFNQYWNMYEACWRQYSPSEINEGMFDSLSEALSKLTVTQSQ